MKFRTQIRSALFYLALASLATGAHAECVPGTKSPLTGKCTQAPPPPPPPPPSLR